MENHDAGTLELWCECDTVDCKKKVKVPKDRYYAMCTRDIVVLSGTCPLSVTDRLIEETPNYKLAYVK